MPVSAWYVVTFRAMKLSVKGNPKVKEKEAAAEGAPACANSFVEAQAYLPNNPSGYLPVKDIFEFEFHKQQCIWTVY